MLSLSKMFSGAQKNSIAAYVMLAEAFMGVSLHTMGVETPESLPQRERFPHQREGEERTRDRRLETRIVVRQSAASTEHVYRIDND